MVFKRVFIIYFDKTVLVTLLLPQDNVLRDTDSLLAEYAEWGGHDLTRLTGGFSPAIDYVTEWS